MRVGLKYRCELFQSSRNLSHFRVSYNVLGDTKTTPSHPHHQGTICFSINFFHTYVMATKCNKPSGWLGCQQLPGCLKHASSLSKQGQCPCQRRPCVLHLILVKRLRSKYTLVFYLVWLYPNCSATGPITRSPFTSTLESCQGNTVIQGLLSQMLICLSNRKPMSTERTSRRRSAQLSCPEPQSSQLTQQDRHTVGRADQMWEQR